MLARVAAGGATQSCQAAAAKEAQPSLGGSDRDADIIGGAREGDAFLQVWPEHRETVHRPAGAVRHSGWREPTPCCRHLPCCPLSGLPCVRRASASQPDPSAHARGYGNCSGAGQAARQETQALRPAAERGAPDAQHRRVRDQRSGRIVLGVPPDRLSRACKAILKTDPRPLPPVPGRPAHVLDPVPHGLRHRRAQLLDPLDDLALPRHGAPERSDHGR